MMSGHINKTKVIGLILAFVIAYGQLVASVHLTTHLKPHDSSQHQGFSTFVSDSSHFYKVPFSQLVESLKDEGFNLAVSHSFAEPHELTCALYHVLLGFSGLLFLADHLTTNNHSSVVISTQRESFLVLDRPTNVPIRAPPKRI